MKQILLICAVVALVVPHPTNTTAINKSRRFLMADMLKVKAALSSRPTIDAQPWGGYGRWREDLYAVLLALVLGVVRKTAKPAANGIR
jgi:hypothetical protein